MVLADRPALYLPLSAPRGSGEERDLSPNRFWGSYLPRGSSPAKTRLPNGDLATVLEGLGQYLETPSAAAFSIRRNGLTLEAWIRPDTLEFPHAEGDGYVYWLGKGETGRHEYAGRM